MVENLASAREPARIAALRSLVTAGDGQRNANRKPLSEVESASAGIHLIGDSCQIVSGQEMVW